MRAQRAVARCGRPCRGQAATEGAAVDRGQPGPAARRCRPARPLSATRPRSPTSAPPTSSTSSGPASSCTWPASPPSATGCRPRSAQRSPTRDRAVAVLLGDGALMFSVQEIVTAVEQRLPLPDRGAGQLPATPRSRTSNGCGASRRSGSTCTCPTCRRWPGPAARSASRPPTPTMSPTLSRQALRPTGRR